MVEMPFFFGPLTTSNNTLTSPVSRGGGGLVHDQQQPLAVLRDSAYSDADHLLDRRALHTQLGGHVIITPSSKLQLWRFVHVSVDHPIFLGVFPR